MKGGMYGLIFSSPLLVAFPGGSYSNCHIFTLSPCTITPF